MEKTKKYYWIKLKTDFFNIAEMDFLLSQENGCKYIVLYQMLCLLTANSNGELFSKVGEMIVPYDVDKIVRDTKYFSSDTVRVALEAFRKLNLISGDEFNYYRITGFDTMVGSETAWAKQKREQRQQQKLLGGHCPDNVRQEIEIELDRKKDGLNYIIFNNMEFLKLLQEETNKYDEILKSKKVYLESMEYMPESIIESYKLYQLAVKRLYDNKQAELLEKVNVSVLEKVFGNVIKAKDVDDIVEYYITSLVNELAKGG